MRDQDKAEELMEDINKQIEVFQEEGDKCLKGNSSAGARSRKASSALTKLFKEYRKVTV